MGFDPYHVRDYEPNTNVMQAGGLITFVNNEEEGPLRSLGDRVKWARTKRKLSQADLGKAAGVSQGTIGNIEAGIRKQPRELLAIAAALKVRARWLDNGKGDWEVNTSAPAPVGSLFDELTEDEQHLLENFRALLDDDQRAIAEDISDKAAKMRAYTAKVLERVGAGSKLAKNSADAKKTEVARAALDVTERLRQASIFDDKGRRD